MDEYDAVLHYDEIRKKILHYSERLQAAHRLLRLAVIVQPHEQITAIHNDSDDNKFLEAAVAGNAHFIVSQDKKHVLPLKEFRGIKIMTPEEFLSHRGHNCPNFFRPV